VVRDFVGHGSAGLHEDPDTEFREAGDRTETAAGMILAIEPMVNAGGWPWRCWRRWTVVTRDRSRSAHFEHTVAVTRTA